MRRQNPIPGSRNSKRSRKFDQSKNDMRRLQIETQKPKSKRSEKPIEPLNNAQRHYDAGMRSADIVFGIGSAGTGKTWLATMRACEAFAAKRISKIIVTRPAVEAGENLGFLPGELEEKYEPYLRPVRDVFVEFFGETLAEYHIASGNIEARPLAYMRGSTFSNVWVIADEMQNATPTQMKLLLTRIGDNAKFIVNGDPGQIDIGQSMSGLIDATKRLEGIDRVSVTNFTRGDIVRSGLCQDVVMAYETDSGDQLRLP